MTSALQLLNKAGMSQVKANLVKQMSGLNAGVGFLVLLFFCCVSYHSKANHVWVDSSVFLGLSHLSWAHSDILCVTLKSLQLACINVDASQSSLYIGGG